MMKIIISLNLLSYHGLLQSKIFARTECNTYPIDLRDLIEILHMGGILIVISALTHI